MPWSPRTGHSVVFEDGSADNGFTRQLHLFGGYGPAPGYKAINDYSPPFERRRRRLSSGGVGGAAMTEEGGATTTTTTTTTKTTVTMADGVVLPTAKSGNKFLDDAWTWQFDKAREYWREDYTSSALYGTGIGKDFHYNDSAPTVNYVTEHSNVSMLQRFWVPIRRKYRLPLTVRRGL